MWSATPAHIAVTCLSINILLRYSSAHLFLSQQMADRNGLTRDKVQSLSDVKVDLNHETDKVRKVIVKDVQIPATELQGTLVHLWTFVNAEVRRKYMETFAFGDDKVRASIFLGILWYEKYHPESAWVMQDHEWNEPVMELLDRFCRDLA